MTKIASNFDVSEYLDNEKDIAEYLSSIVEENDIDLLCTAIGHIAKARGMSKIANDSGLGKEYLYRTLNQKSKPRFDTVMKVLKGMDIQLKFVPAQTL
ncbi:transcriptional regulator [Fibrobacterales bacterium]|nr:transcriptional regulator [Fibrobacterales bacterium]